MGRIKKTKQKKALLDARDLKQPINIPLPDEAVCPAVVGTSFLSPKTAGTNQINDRQIIPLDNAANSLQEIEVILKAFAYRNTSSSCNLPQVPPEIEVVLKAFATIATNAWRAKTKMVAPDTGETKEEMRRVYRHIEAIFEALNKIGVDMIDPIGRVYDSGMALRVVSFEPTPGLSNEEIKETLRPSIAWKGRLIQMGEVVVGTPQTI